MMNYIVQLNTFENLCTGILPPKAQLIYYKLFKWSNRIGLGEPFRLSNSLLMLETGITNENTFISNRNLLKQRGFIDFKSGKKGSPTEYLLMDLQNFTINTSVNIEGNIEVNPAVNIEVNPAVNPAVKNGFLHYVNNINKQNKQNKQSKKENVKEKRHKYGQYENVLLSDSELQKLQEEFPADWQDRIEKLSGYIASTGKKYSNFLATIRNWARNEQPKRIGKNDAASGYQRTLELLGIGDANG